MERGSAARLEIFKALGDNTRYAIFLELARAPHPLATAEIAETLDLHPNTVRPHLERMRDAGLLDVRADASGAVGRPQHLYSLAADAPSLGLEPAVFPLLARILLDAAALSGVDPTEVVDAARAHSGAAADPGACIAALQDELTGMGFDPASVVDDEGATIAFTRCPFRELAEANPDLVCSIHRGLVEGFVERTGGAQVTEFHTLVDRTPCQVHVQLVPADRGR